MSKDNEGILPARKVRPLPAFLCYASDFMAEEAYMLGGLPERGLLFSLLTYCWANDAVPADRRLMAKLLCVEESDIEIAYGPLIKKHLHPLPSDPNRLYAPELDRQKQEAQIRRELKSAGGRRGGTATQRRNRQASNGSSIASSSAKAAEMKGDELNRKDASRNEGFPVKRVTGNTEKWINDYDGTSADDGH